MITAGLQWSKITLVLSAGQRLRYWPNRGTYLLSMWFWYV